MFTLKTVVPTTFMLLFVVLLTGVVIGANTGFEAATIEDARIDPKDFDRTEPNEVGEDFETYDNPAVPNELEHGGDVSPWMGKHIANFVNLMVTLALTLAGKVSVFVFNNKSWMSQQWTIWTIQAFGYAGVFSFFGYYIYTFRRFLGSVRPAK